MSDPARGVKLRELQRAYATPTLVACVGGYAAITLLGQGLTAWLDRTSLGGWWGLCIPWLVVASALPLLFGLGKQFSRAPVIDRLPSSFWPQQLLVLLWLALLSWYTAPAFAPLLLFVLVGLVFSDVTYVFDAPGLKVVYALFWPLQIAVLVLVDVLGGPGLLARFAREETRVWLTLASELCLLLLLQIIIRVVGGNHREKEEGYRAAGRLEAELRAMETERGVLARSCDFLLHGLSATRFSHDVASPLSVLRVTAHAVGSELETVPGPQSAEIRRLLERMEIAIQRLEDMTRTMARSLRQSGQLQSASAAELVRQAVEYCRQTLEQHQLQAALPALAVQDTEVVVSAEHTSAVASIITNSMLEGGSKAPSIKGEAIDELFYQIQIRDWGLQGQERVQALRTIEQSMAFDNSVRGPEARRRTQYEGYGIGLLMTRVLIVRSGGWLSVHPPAEGPGICFSVILPRRDPGQIPVERNYPERLGVDGRRGFPAVSAGRLRLGERASRFSAEASRDGTSDSGHEE